MSEAAWRRRFRAARVTLPGWARDRPERCLYASTAGGTWELYSWDRATDAHRQVTSRPEGTLAGTLDPAGEWIWWFDDDRGKEFGRWVREPFAGGPIEPVAPDLPPAYRAGLAIARDFAVIGSATDSGVTIDLAPFGERPRRLYEHAEHATLGGMSRDESLFCIVHSERGDSRHPELRVLDRAGQTVAELSDGPGRGLWASEWSRVAGDQRLIVQHERRDLGRPLVWNVATGETRDLFIDLPGEVDASWYPDGSALLLLHDYRGRGELYRLDLATERLERVEHAPGTVYGARIRPDGTLWYARTDAATPLEIRAGDGVLLHPPGDPAPPGVPYRDHTVEGIHFFLSEPAGSRPHPVIFQIHGGPEAHDQDAFSPTVQAWVDHGYAVVLINYRGSSGYGKAWRDALEGNPGLTELADIAKVHEWLLTTGVAVSDKIVLAGASWGGYLTLLGLGTQPDRWSLGIAAVPVADYVAAYEDEMEPLKAYDRALFGGAPDEIPNVYRERSPITYVEQVRVPVLILAGENDPRCPIRQIDNYLARLCDLGMPHEVYRYDAGHGSLVIDEVIKQVATEIDFAARHLGTPAPTS